MAIIDLIMPEMNGEKTLAKMKVIDPNVIGRLSSGQEKEHAPSLVTRLGAAVYLEKPYKISQLTGAIEEALQWRSS
jgi:DNA-binding NtrC family response regulator